VLPLSVRSDVRGLLIVSTTARISPEVADSLDALGTQVSLALEGASLAEDLHRRQSEARLRSLVAHSSDLITVLDENGRVTYQSPSIERVLGDRVEHALVRAQRGFADIAVMFIDLDDFKTVNDSLGHAAADLVLQEVARRLKLAVRPTDTVARFGGDEFAVLLDGVADSSESAD